MISLRKIFILMHLPLLQLGMAMVPDPLPAWEEGMLDVHFINAGTGNCSFLILPDGTTFLVDAGEQNPTSPRVLSPRNTPRYPNYSRLGHQWQADYIKNMHPFPENSALDYVLITHYHGDHYGDMYPGIPKSEKGNYYLSGITGLGDIIPIKKIIDRGTHYPMNLKAAASQYPAKLQSLINYWSFIEFHQQQNDLEHETFEIGSNRQFALKRKPKAFPEFSIRNINANGEVWSGQANKENIWRLPDTTEVKSSGIIPSENTLSCGILIEYGPFRFYNGGDIQGKQPDYINKPEWFDVESIVAPVVGEVDVTTCNHHANRDAMSAYYLSVLKPRVIIQEVWSSDHPGHEALLRMTSRHIWPDERDLFATNMLAANYLVIGDLLERSYKSAQGHIVLRVMAGGEEYYIYTLNHLNTTREITGTYGPYTSKK